jgi:two-component system, NarL family, nitrate/nitrite response regulator NarL
MPHPLRETPASVRIVIADEYPIFRDGLRRLLETDASLHIVGDAAVGSAAVALVRELEPHILLLCPAPAADSASETLRQLAESGVPVRTILLLRSIDMPEVAEALQFGACGILSKDSAADVLFESIESVMAGHYWVGHERTPDIAVGMRRFATARRHEQRFGLTRREQDILRAVIDGDTNKEIARRLSISENTVKRHMMHIFNKVGASSRVELALFAAHHRLLDNI